MFPASLDALQAYDAVILSDIGSNSILLHPDVWLKSQTFPNRLKLLRDWVSKGGSLAMIGRLSELSGDRRSRALASDAGGRRAAGYLPCL